MTMPGLDDRIGQSNRDLTAFMGAGADDTRTIELAVDGIHCAACMATIERAMTAYPGVRSARLNFTDKRLTLAFAAEEADPAGAIERLSDLGFTAYPFAPKRQEAAEDREQARLLRALGVAGFAAMNIMLLSVSVWSGHETGLDKTTRDFFHLVSALIALPTAAYSGRVFFDSALGALRARRVNMDVPISLGILLALGMSVVETLHGGEHAYFDGAVMLIFFLLIGRVLDAVMMRRTRAVATNLAALKAQSAMKRMPDGVVRDVPVEMVEPGDIILAAAGDRIALDGIVIEGLSEIDTSLVTGETAHVAVRAGEAVYAGTLNLSGLLAIRVLKPHTGTLLADVERLLAQATARRGAYTKLADRAARLYAPFVHTAALITFLGWMFAGLSWSQALVIAITVLIITCPCALGLAIPAVQVVASGALFRSRLLLHAGDAIERLAEVDTVVFDKTGTLTLPAATIANVEAMSPAILARAASLARASRHPLSKPIADAAAGETLRDVREVAGQGVEAEEGGRVLRLGSLAFCRAEHAAADLGECFPDASLVAFRDGDDAPVVFAIRQPLRAEAAQTIADLKRMGLRVELLSGDRATPVRQVAEALGITEWRAGATPADKVARLEALRAEGRKVLMVGDGLNDAAALAAADVSLSPVSASHLAQAAADMLMLGESLAPVADAIAISCRARRLMMQNLWMSVLYNLVAVPVAVMGYATPLVAALAMSGSSVLVTVNALRAGLRRRGGA
jgi:Cu2+-exporting ATPase